MSVNIYMRLVDSGDVAFDEADARRVAGAAHCAETAVDAYGPGTDVGPWSRRGVRRVGLSILRPAGLDAVLQTGGEPSSFVRATLTQRVVRDDLDRGGPLDVRGSIRLHVLGAELIKIRPMTTVAASACTGSVMRTTVEMHAVFPPPLCGIVEAIMADRARSEVRRFVEAVRRRVASTSTEDIARRWPGASSPRK